MFLNTEDNKNKYSDFILFTDDDKKDKDWFVKILEINATFVKFETNNGTIMVLPSSSVKKIKYKTNEGGQN